jgi:hypothetical protein
MSYCHRQQSEAIGVLIYTYNRTDDALINMEIVRNIWARKSGLECITLIHAFDGDHAWWPLPYLEDELIRLTNPGHYEGAALLLDHGLTAFVDRHPDIQYVVVIAADTWCLNPSYIVSVIDSMRGDNKYLATCAWGTAREAQILQVGAAADFFVVDIRWASKHRFVPLRYAEFKEKYGELILYRNELVTVERLIALRFTQAISRSEVIPSDNLLVPIAYKHIYRMKEREPIHVIERGQWRRLLYNNKLGLLGHHDPNEKRRACEGWNLELGQYGRKFFAATTLDWYNRGVVKTFYKQGNTIFECSE